MKKQNLILEQIAAIRKKLKYTQADVARQLSIDRSTYVRKEKGDIPLTLKELILIIHFLKINPKELFKSLSSKK